jgi:DNA-binding NarL/FixJ family response regulator
LETTLTRVLVVDDSEIWRRFFSSTLQKQPEYQVIGELSDGLVAVQQAQQLQPDLILMDIGLPTLNGIEATRRIREVSPRSKILCVSENRSAEIAEEALHIGAAGYIVKSEAGSELLPAVKAVLLGKQFVSTSLTSRNLNAPTDSHVASIRHCHEVAFYADDGSLVDGYARFIESALKIGKAVIVVLTEAHRASLLPRLEADGVDVRALIERGTCILLDAVDALTRLILNDSADPDHCRKVIDDLIMGAAKGVKGEHGGFAVCGEIAPILLSRGNTEDAIKLEHLWDEIARGYGVQTLCGYLSNAFPDHESSPVFKRICDEHSAIRGLDY